MKPFFIEIVSCAKDRPKQWAPRLTWIQEWGDLVDYKFLLGEGNINADEDEWILPANDSWDGKVEKMQCAHKRILELGYPYTFHISLDCYPIVPRLLTAFHALMQEPLPWQRDYVGTKSGGGDFLGEAGFWMSRKALEVLVDTPIPAEGVSYEDMYWGQLLHSRGIKMVSTPDYESGDQTNTIFPYKDSSVWQTTKREQKSVHLGRGTGTFDPTWMQECHASYMSNGDHLYSRPGL